MLLKEKIPFSYTFGKIRYEMLIILGYSVLVWVLYHNFHFVRIAIPLSVPAILGTVISLLLGFRSNQAYDRWWEARHIWGAIVNDSRTLARQVQSFAGKGYADAGRQQFRSRLTNRQIAWAYSLGQHLRSKDPMEGLEPYLDEEDIDYLKGFTNIPAALLALHGRDIDYALEMDYINRYQKVELDRTITRLCDAQGKCERIKNTIFPSTYSMYIHFSLLLFIGLLPFGLIDYFGVAEILAVTAISSCFLLIEKMAIHLQDPFDNKPTDTPVTTIAGNIDRDLKQLLSERVSVPRVAEKADAEKEVFYVM
jgi:putative membrane protein